MSSSFFRFLEIQFVADFLAKVSGVKMNDSVLNGARKGKKEYEYGDPVAAEESSDPTDNELKEDSEEGKGNDTGSAAESSRSITSEKDEVEGGSQNEASSSEEEEVKSEDKANEVSVDSIRTHEFFKDKSKSRRRGRRSEIVNG